MKKSPYDRERFFEKYSQMDRSRLGLAGAGEWESLEPLLPDFAGKRVLDLGCGYGWHCIYAAEHGAAAVTGVDLSEKMLAVAREKTTAPQVTYIRGDMAETPFPPESFDVVLSSLAIHYLPSFTDFLERVRQCLSPGGDFVFSVEHPIFTAAGPQEWYYGPDGTPLHFPVDRYFEEGRRTARFLGGGCDQVPPHPHHLSGRPAYRRIPAAAGGGASAAGADAGPAGNAGRAPPPHDAAGLRPEADGVAARKTGAARRPRMKNCWKIMNTQKGRTAP